MTSWSFCWAARTASSMSANSYAGSNGSVAVVGRVFATRFHWTRRRMIEALSSAEPRTRSGRSGTQRKLGSSWKPTHIAPPRTTAGAARPASTDKTTTRRTMRLTNVSWRAARFSGAVRESGHPSGCRVRLVLATGEGCARLGKLDWSHEPFGVGGHFHARRAQDPDDLPRGRRLVRGSRRAAAGDRARRGRRARTARPVRLGGLEAHSASAPELSRGPLRPLPRRTARRATVS